MSTATLRSTFLCSRSELHVVAALRTARPVVELHALVAAAADRGGRVVGVHDRLDENHRVVRRAEGVLQVADSPDDERSRRRIGKEHLRQIAALLSAGRACRNASTRPPRTTSIPGTTGRSIGARGVMSMVQTLETGRRNTALFENRF